MLLATYLGLTPNQFYKHEKVKECFGESIKPPNVMTLSSLTQVAMKGKGLRARRENNEVGKA
jgi:hypothetical protein